MSVGCARDLAIQKGRVFAEPDGVKLKLNVYQPKDRGDGLLPGMVVVHGGGWVIGPRTQQAWYCREFARNGYVVITIDYRMMPKYAFPHCLHDCKAGVRWMRAHAAELGVDPDHIVTFGASAGGHLAAFLAVADPEDGFEGEDNPGPSSHVNAAASLYGVLDFTKYRDQYPEKFMKKFAGPEGEKRGVDPLVVASPITYLKPDTPPIFLAHGTSDILVPYSQSVAFHERLLELGIATRFVTYPKRNHGFDYVHWKQRRDLFGQMLEFLREHGQPREK